MSDNGSVWLKEVEIALRKKIRELVKPLDSEGNEVPVKVIVLKPEKEIEQLTYPCVTIYCYDQKFDLKRYQDGYTVTNIDKSTGKGTLEDNARPYNLYYQVEFWTEYLEDLNKMTRDWAERVLPFSVLECTDTQGNVRECFMEQIKDVANIDNSKSNESKRLFRKIYSYKIWVELDNPVSENTQLITDVDVKIK